MSGQASRGHAPARYERATLISVEVIDTAD